MDYKYSMTISHISEPSREAERAVALQLLRGDHAPDWSRDDLLRELRHVAPRRLDRAVAALESAGVIERAGAVVRASAPARKLDELELIGI